MRKLKHLAAALAATAFLSGPMAPRVTFAAGETPAAFKTALTPKALSNNVQRGLKWLADHQLPNGAWGQGDEAPGMRGGGADPVRDVGSVADTSMALLALLRAGHSPGRGEFGQNVQRGLEYVLSEVEASDQDSLYVTKTRGTRVQGKIGTYVDTFAALLVLTEAKQAAGNTPLAPRIGKATTKIIAKIEKNQRADGTWANEGWAPVLTQSIASKGLNRASQAGEGIKGETLRRVEQNAQRGFDAKSGSFDGGGSAGVDLYGTAAGASTARDSANTRKAAEPELRRKMEAAPPAERAKYQATITEGQQTQAVAENAEKALMGRMSDPNFVRGFGNNGGEEFLSYMLLSETLAAKGGDEWKRWDTAITQLVNGVQNQDGSWTGHHCITGRTFCTAAALLVLMGDRTPVPTAAKLRG